MNRELIEAFVESSDGFSPDRVVADRELNSAFVTSCRQRGLTSSHQELNRALLNLRKAGKLTDIRKSKQTRFKNAEQYSFASEMAIRFLERRDSVSLDDVLCDPALADEFDQLAESIAPGYSSLEYRWAALMIRKTKQLQPEVAGRIVPPTDVLKFSAEEIDVSKIPTAQGLYLFFDSQELLYVGEAENLRARLKKHLDHSDNKGLARWMWEHGNTNLQIEVQTLPPNTSNRVRKSLELELIRSRNPVFNVKR